VCFQNSSGLRHDGVGVVGVRKTNKSQVDNFEAELYPTRKITSLKTTKTVEAKRGIRAARIDPVLSVEAGG
jgi:hypothetical protein